MRSTLGVLQTVLDELPHLSADQEEAPPTGALDLEELALYLQPQQLGARFPAAGATILLSLGEAGVQQTQARRAR